MVEATFYRALYFAQRTSLLGKRLLMKWKIINVYFQ